MRPKKSDYLPTRRHFLSIGFGAALVTHALRADDEKKQDCPLTDEDIEGPFYRADAPFESNLRQKRAGDVLFVSGKVEGMPGCVPLKNAIVDVWQADSSGHYDNEDEKADGKKFELRGRIKTNAAGQYEFETIVPAVYKIGPERFRPAHIHYKISAPGYKAITTQLYFKGDAHLKNDPYAKPSRTVALVKHEDKEALKKRGLEKLFYSCVFNIVLKKA